MFRYAQGVLRSILFGTPLNVRLWLTSRCNYRCRMCAVPGMQSSPEMTLEVLSVVADNLKKIGVSQVIFTGGEPLLRDDIVDIVRLFHQYGFILRIQTNGGAQVTEELLDRCYAAGLDDISISLDTLDAAKQDRICNADNVLVNALRVIRYCKQNYSRKGVVAVNVVISRQNFFELPALIEYVHSMGVFFDPCIFTRNFSSAPTNDFRNCNDEFSLLGLDSYAVSQVFKKIEAYIHRNYRIVTTKRTLDALKSYMLNGDCRWNCLAGQLSLDITPTGELAPCCDTLKHANESPVADLKHSDFLSVFNSKAFREKCRKIRAKCSGCLFGCYRDPKYLISDIRVQTEALYKSVIFGKVLQ